MFTKVPSHITLLFLFLCGCQLLLLIQLNSKHSPNTLGFIDLPTNRKENQEGHNKIQDGKLRLLSLNSDETVINSVINEDVIINQQYLCQLSFDSNTNDDIDDDYDIEETEVRLLVLIHSHPSHKPQRDAIRATWGQKNITSGVRVLFVLGRNEDEQLHDDSNSEFIYKDIKALYKEARLYRDIIMGNFTDTYTHLSTKALFGLQWASLYCSNAKYILKTDDDTYFNVNSLLRDLLTSNNIKPIMGSVNKNAAVSRHGLWKVNPEVYPDKTYPVYCSGCAYMISQTVIPGLLQAHQIKQRDKILPIEDVYVTGVLAQESGLQCQTHKQFPYWSKGPSRENIELVIKDKLFGVHNIKYETMYLIHKMVKLKQVIK